MKKIAVFPGSFDPFTLGHESIVLRALPLFDEIIIALGFNSNKEGYFPVGKRMRWIKKVFEKYPNIRVEKYDKLTVDFCKDNNAGYIIRGLRTSSDFEYERMIAQMNKALDTGIETVFILTTPDLTYIHSNTIREVLKHGGDASRFVPAAINLNE